MGRGGDIVGISLPFSGGLILGAVLSSFEPCSKLQFWWWAALFISACIVLLILVCAKSLSTRYLILLYFCLGFFSFCSSNICGQLKLSSPEFITRASDGFCALIERTGFSENIEPLIIALLSGRKEGLSRDLISSFRSAGASHLLALSGLHLGIIYGLLCVLLICIGRSPVAYLIRSIICICLTGLYVIISGVSPSVVRAFLFITLNEFSRLNPGRRHSQLGTFCTALCLQLVAYPLVIFDLGFQLSYLAMLGIIFIFPVLKEWYPSKKRYDPFRRIWTSISLSISCQVCTAPLVWIKFGSFPRYFLLSNLIALPLTECLIILSLICIGTESIGLKAEMLKSLTNALGEALIYCLKVIGDM